MVQKSLPSTLETESPTLMIEDVPGNLVFEAEIAETPVVEEKEEASTTTPGNNESQTIIQTKEQTLIQVEDSNPGGPIIVFEVANTLAAAIKKWAFGWIDQVLSETGANKDDYALLLEAKMLRK